MSESRRHTWILAALLLGVAYFVVGRVFAAPVTHVQVWRWAAWLVSAAAYAAHLWYEHVRLGNARRAAAVHVAVAVAIGAFGLAVAGMIHSLSAASGIRPAWLVALVAWPAFLAVPAFLVAFVALSILPRRPARADAE